MTVMVPGDPPDCPVPEDTRTEDERAEDAVAATIEAFELGGYHVGAKCAARPTVTRTASLEEFRSYGVCGQSETAPSTHCLHLGIETIFLAPGTKVDAQGEPLVRAALQWALYCDNGLGSPDTSDARYWDAAGGDESVQAHAWAIFAEAN